MGEAYESRRITKDNITEKKPHELLVQLGGALAILLSLVIFAFEWKTPLAMGPTTTLVITLVLGGALIVSGAILRKSLMNGAIVAIVVSVILIFFGEKGALVGGIVGIAGAIVALASPYLPSPKHH